MGKKVHFLGIGGSGLSGVAQIAAASGFEVSGCDQATDTPYIDKVRQSGIQVFTGHDASHLENVDILAVTPAVFYQNDNHPEIVAARQKNILMKWQEFMGRYLHEGKELICIAGTHGKSTTTTMAGLLLESARVDPTVEVGATVPAWHSNVRVGHGKHFITEADEFHNNFGSYHPDILVLNNIEMDHPEYFGTTENMLSVFQQLINRIPETGHLIYNADSPLIGSLLLPKNAIAYSLNQVTILRQDISGTSFRYQDRDYHVQLPGIHNVANALGIIELAGLLGIDHSVVNQTLTSFSGIGRRMERISDHNGVVVFDDYANHPTAFMASIQSARQLHPDGQVWAVIEPHTFSRLRAVLSELPKALSGADHVIVSQIFASREQDPGDFSGADIAAAASHPDSRYIPEFADIVAQLKNRVQSPAVILVMGSGLSYKLAREISAAFS